MKKIALLAFATLLVFGPVFLVTAPEAYAGGNGGIETRSLPEDPVTVEDAIGIIFNAAFWLLLLVAGIFFLLGAFYFLTAGQNPDNATKGKSIITYAIIAIIVAILARGLAEFIPRMFDISV